MLRKLLTVGVVAGALALTAASASSLGDPGDATVASTTISVDDCELASGVDFEIGQLLKENDKAPLAYYVTGMSFEVTDGCVGEELDFRLLGATSGNNNPTLASGFDVPVTSTSVTVPVSGQPLVEDVMRVTLAIH